MELNEASPNLGLSIMQVVYFTKDINPGTAKPLLKFIGG